MTLHPLLTRQLAHLGLDHSAPPSTQSWSQLLAAISQSYQNTEQNSYYAAFYQQTEDAVLVVNDQSHCLAANGMAGFMFGAQYDLSRSHDLADLLPPALVALFQEHIQQIFQHKTTRRWNYQFSDQDLTRYQEAQLSLIDPTQALLVVRDITERRWADDTARIAREYFKRLIQGLHVGMLIYGKDGELLLSNRQARLMLGLPDTHTWDDSSIDQSVTLVQEDGTPFVGFSTIVQEFVKSTNTAYNTVIGVYRQPNTERIWLMVNVRAEYTQAQLDWVTITLNDITDLRHTESALRASERLYQSLVNNMREVIFQIDSEGTWLFLNPAWTQITGYTLLESVNQPVFSFVHPEDRARLHNELLNFQQRQPNFDLQEIRCLTKEGGFRWLSVRSDPIFSPDNTLVGITGTLTDITERKQTESQAAALAAKENMVMALRTLLDSLSHDLRTPLSVINANLFLMRRKIHDVTAVQSYLNVLEQQTFHLAQMVDDVVTISTLDNETDTFAFDYVDLNQMINHAITGFDKGARAKNLTLDRHLASDLPLIRSDQIWLERMLKHLLLNALQYTREHGSITITTQSTGEGVILLVADNGSGIDPQDLPHIFEHFYRADKARPKHSGGAGLGLTIVKKVVEAHQGKIEVESTLNQGTTFRVYLPLRP